MADTLILIIADLLITVLSLKTKIRSFIEGSLFKQLNRRISQKGFSSGLFLPLFKVAFKLFFRRGNELFFSYIKLRIIQSHSSNKRIRDDAEAMDLNSGR